LPEKKVEDEYRERGGIGRRGGGGEMKNLYLSKQQT
jgi:hypothetical protein